MQKNIESSKLKCNNNQEEKMAQQIKLLLEQIKSEQINIQQNINNNYKIIVKKLDKLQEYNKIDDMTSTIFEGRISRIEQILEEINRKII